MKKKKLLRLFKYIEYIYLSLAIHQPTFILAASGISSSSSSFSSRYPTLLFKVSRWSSLTRTSALALIVFFKICLSGTVVNGQTYTLTSCAPLSNTVIALNMTTILLRFPFNRMPSNEICASTISPTRMALGLMSWCLRNSFQNLSDIFVVHNSLSSPGFLMGFIIFNFIVFCMDELLSHRLRKYVFRVNS
jgi:hypothetical protein